MILSSYSVSFAAAIVCALLGLALSSLTQGKRIALLGKDTVILLLLVFVGSIVGFAIGFYGPIFMSPDANQGPLLGIFVTGPLGAVVGLAIFSVYLFTHG